MLTVLTLAQGGCVSIAARTAGHLFELHPVRPALYPGLSEGARYVSDSGLATRVLFVIDVPLSFVLDTLLLPFDLVERAEYDDQREAEAAEWAGAERVVSAAPDQRALADLAIADPRPKVRYTAVSRLTDQIQLARVATDGQAWAEQSTAIQRITDPAVLRALFDADVPASVKGAARDRLIDLAATGGPPTSRP